MDGEWNDLPKILGVLELLCFDEAEYQLLRDIGPKNYLRRGIRRIVSGPRGYCPVCGSETD